MSMPALSVRQPWAWAVIHGGKDVENRTARSITLGGMANGLIRIHAAKGMTRDEYESAAAFMARLGVVCPHPANLVRGAVIGTVIVTEIVRTHSSPWFFGPCALVLAAPTAIGPIPGPGKLGYFEHCESGEVNEPLPWMKAWTEPDVIWPKGAPLPLFETRRA